MLKKILLITAVLGLTSSCVLVRFPNEINIRMSFPEHMSKGEINHIISKFPKRMDHPKGNMRIHVFKDKDSIKYGAKEFLFISEDGNVVKKDSTNLFIIKEDKNK